MEIFELTRYINIFLLNQVDHKTTYHTHIRDGHHIKHFHHLDFEHYLEDIHHLDDIHNLTQNRTPFYLPNFELIDINHLNDHHPTPLNNNINSDLTGNRDYDLDVNMDLEQNLHYLSSFKKIDLHHLDNPSNNYLNELTAYVYRFLHSNHTPNDF